MTFNSGQTSAGTPVFMPPEQIINFKYVKPVSDVFSMGATMYFLLTGAFPFDFSSKRDPLDVVLNNEVIPIRKRFPSVPKPLASAIDRAVTKEKKNRYPDAGGAAVGLEIIHPMKSIHANKVNIAISDSPHPVLVDFFSPSCPPCTALLPVLEELAIEFAGRVDFVKADAMADDESLKLSASLGIRAVPTLILFKNGTEAARRTGAASKAALASWLLENL